MSAIHIVRDYPHPPAKVWRALTVPELIALWAMRPEGFSPVVGNRFKLVAKPGPGWRGFVECEVLEARAPSVLRYSWIGDDDGTRTEVKFTLEPHGGGTRLTFEHTGFTGVGGFILAKLMMGPGWKKMIGRAIPAVLADLDEEGDLKAGSSLEPEYRVPGRGRRQRRSPGDRASQVHNRPAVAQCAMHNAQRTIGDGKRTFRGGRCG